MGLSEANLRKQRDFQRNSFLYLKMPMIWISDITEQSDGFRL